MLIYKTENILHIEKGEDAELKISASFKEKHYFDNIKDFTDYCMKVDLNEFLGLPKSFSCIFHDDNNESAGIVERDGKFFYKCFSSNCKCSKKALTIIHIVKEIRGKSYSDTYNFLCNVLNCSIPLKGNDRKINSTININKKALCELTEKAPTAARLLKKDIEVLNGLYDLVQINGMKMNKRNDIVYSVSQRFLENYLKEKLNKNKLISKSLTFLAYLGFIEKIPYYKTNLIDIDTLIRVSKESLADGHSSRMTMQLLIKKIDDKTIYKIEKNAKRWKKLGYTKEMLSFANIAEKEGVWKANELYPQV